MTTHEVVSVEEWQKPLPGPDDVTAPYWKAAAEGRLLVQECPGAGTASGTRAPCARSAPRSRSGSSARAAGPSTRTRSCVRWGCPRSVTSCRT